MNMMPLGKLLKSNDECVIIVEYDTPRKISYNIERAGKNHFFIYIKTYKRGLSTRFVLLSVKNNRLYSIAKIQLPCFEILN